MPLSLGLKVTKTVSNPPFPVSMLFVNLLGAFGLGLFTVVIMERFRVMLMMIQYF
ncbi:hypothetical protein AAAC51_21740 [Priestia megaterium]